MTRSTPWIGSKRVAFVPLYRTNAAPPDQIPPNWEDAILSRVIYDPRPLANGADRSLRAWLRAVSSGVADIDPFVVPMETIDRQVVEAVDLEQRLGDRLRSQGADAAVLVMLGGRGAGTNSGFWSRVVMAESNGVWLMELIHGLTNFKDLYDFGNDVDPPERGIGHFDQMSASSQTHPTAFTKNELGWLQASAFRQHVLPVADYELQHISLAQPPSAGRAAAIQIGEDVPYVLVESRKMTDQFESGLSTTDSQEKGIPGEGVIAYRVQTRDITKLPREGFKKPLYVLTLQALQGGQSATLDNGVVLTVASVRPGGVKVRLVDPSKHLLDRSATVGAPKCASAPCALVLDDKQINDVAYRAENGHLHEIWHDAAGQGTGDLTANANSTPAQGNPFFYFDPSGDQVILVYRGSDNHVHCLYWMFGAVGHDNLTGSVNAPKTASDPVGWFSTHDGLHHVAYRTSNGHLNELSWQGPGAVVHRDLTAAAGAVSAVGNPWPYYDPPRAMNVVFFRGSDANIRSVYWGTDGTVGQDDLSGYAHMPDAASDPHAWFTPAEDTHRVLYTTANGRLVELSWVGNAPVSGRIVNELAGSPPAQGDVSGGHNPAENSQHMIYRSADGGLHELWHMSGEVDVHYSDLTSAYGAPKAAPARPAYFVTKAVPNQHVAYRGTDGHVYELLW